MNWAPLTKPLLVDGHLLVGDSLGTLFDLARDTGAIRRWVRYPMDFIERTYGAALIPLTGDSGRAILPAPNHHDHR